ncbi:MAG: YbaK/EbsC family protein [Actinobacteria bacterium]|nr:YbaK/EbsC family protein [Actinomycetota bacterium]
MAAGGRERFLARAEELGLEVEHRRFPDGTRTAVQAADAVGCEVDQIVKSLVFVADGEPVLALTSGAHRVDTGRLATALGAESVRKADADEVRGATGYAIGGTPPVGHTRPLRTLLDPRLLDFEEVWAAAGTPMDVFPLAPTRLRELADAEVVDVTEG